MQHHHTDMLIIGAGGAGLRAAIAASQSNLTVTIISKVKPERSHTMAAQGGINAALGTRGADDWRWHLYDTVRGADWLCDQDSAARLCSQAPDTIRELADWGVPFSRDDLNQIYQRAYGGQTVEYGKAPAYRACAAEDRTGQAMMQVLIARAKASKAQIIAEYFALDLIMDNDGACLGAICMDIATGQLHAFFSQLTVLATGGYGQVYEATTAANTCTGDGNAMLLRAGLGLQDMEFVQFHPTGLYGSGILITEGARGEGGFLLNGENERFMKRYAPELQDLASRDVIARAMVQELRAGRGAGTKRDHLWLDLRHLSEDIWQDKLPYILTLTRMLTGLDARRDLVPVVPTVHYSMGGIPTNLHSQVMDVFNQNRVVPGLMAIGEAASNSCHGANRLGCNSLLDLMVFGKDAGEQARATLTPGKRVVADDALAERLAASTVKARFAGQGAQATHLEAHSTAQLRRTIQTIMRDAAPIYRDEAGLAAGLEALQALAPHVGAHLQNAMAPWPVDFLNALEVENLYLQALATVKAALMRQESRGAHAREDFPERDDVHWLCHSATKADLSGKTEHATTPVRFDPEMESTPSIPLQKRAY